MASPPFDIAQTVPGDADFASQFPGLERTFRDVVESWLLIDHNNLGQHSQISMADIASNPTFPAGVIGMWNNAGVPKLRLASGTIFTFDAFPTGTKMIFAQNAPPAGWTLDAAAADKVLRVNNTGGGTGGSWTISGISVDNHTLTIAEMPSHTHTNGGPTSLAGLAGAAGNPVNATNVATGSTGGDGGHNHTLTIGSAWRPAYLDIVIGTKN